MDTRSQFAGRYKKDLSTETLRAKVARRKSITQKENRHKEFRKGRGLALVDGNVTMCREYELSVLEEAGEPSFMKGNESVAGVSKPKQQMSKERLEMLQRFKEEKLLRKLKDQREKAAKGVFKCGLYKPDVMLLPPAPPQKAVKVKPKDQLAPPTTRVTRSAAKAENSANKTTRSQHVPTGVLNSSKILAERTVPRGRGQSSTLKKADKEHKVVPPPTRPLRTTVASAAKVPPKSIAVTKPQEKIVKENKVEPTVQEKSQPQLAPICKTEELVKPQLEVHAEEDICKETTSETETAGGASSLARERKPSFAPDNYKFQPLEGLCHYKLKPMSPGQADRFLNPSFTWSPVRSEKTNLLESPKKETKGQNHLLPDDQDLEPTVCAVETNTTSPPQRKECVTEQNSCTSAQQSPPSQTIISDALQENKELEQLEERQHDVPYFRNILKSETERLFILSAEWEKKVDADIPEDAKDLIRTTVGQTRLLITERFKQFEGLVDNCEFKRGEKETTCTDLDGFWDMIYFQVEDVGKKFVNLGKLEENSWQQNTVQTKRAVKKRIVSVPKQSQGDNGRAAARSRLAAIKAALKDKGKPTEPVAEVASDVPKQLDLVVFDAGFFRIESPAKPKNDVKINRRSSQTPKASKSITKTSRIHVTGRFLEDDVECLEIKGSKSPVGRVLFTAEKESTLNTEESSKSSDFSDNKDDSSQASLVKYLVPPECIDLEFGDSPAAKPSERNLDSILTTNASLVDDVFMTSPGKTVEEISIHSPFTDLGEFADADCKIDDADGIPLRGNCSPSNTVIRAPLAFDSLACDLIVFSPMEK
ncbi:disks large-associated protein 5 [Spea bombifrons]|uniref:disks large-associated protein 5 n=1 Tax=Spea bombifrons TaxID=233779 RepID=UPI00234A921A|nr:disks large-associated protein 5 [Spea bombifrons]